MASTVTGRLLLHQATRRRMLHAVDAAAWLTALTTATATRLSTTRLDVPWQQLMLLVMIASVATLALSRRGRLGVERARRGSIDDAENTIAVWVLTTPLVLLANELLLDRPVPRTAAILAPPMALTIQLGARFGWRVFNDRVRRPVASDQSTRVIIFGAGEGGEQIIRSMLRDADSTYVPVAVLDDSPSKARRAILGVPVLGSRERIAAVAAETGATELLVAIPSAPPTVIADLDLLSRAAGLRVRILPSTTELLGMLDIEDIRELTVADVLGRAEVDVDMTSILDVVAGRRILVTGAGGSIGSELCGQISQLDPAELFMLDRDETALQNLQITLEGNGLLDTPNLIVADIRDAERMERVFAKCQPDVVFHAAALKHLTLLENNDLEGMKTNVVGTKNLLDAAERHNVSRFVNISTDKAADPTSVLGATKLMAERLTAASAASTGRPYVSVRFGNVLDSRGSVLPTFRRQIEAGGPVTVTHPDVTRYFMTIPEAVRLVLQASAIGRPGEIMILDMGTPVKILDLAQRLIARSKSEVDIIFTGLRPGEKLHEVLIGRDEIGTTREHTRITHTVGRTNSDIRREITTELATQLEITTFLPIGGAASNE